MSSTDSSQTIKRQATSETIPASKHIRYSVDGIWKAAGVFGNGVSRSSSPKTLPSCPAGGRSNEKLPHQNHSNTSVGAGAGHEHILSANYAAEINHHVSGQPARVEYGHQPNAFLSRVLAQDIPVEQHSRSHEPWEEGSKGNGKETLRKPFPQSSKGKEREEVAPDSPRPPLRVINADCELDEGHDSDESPPPAQSSYSISSSRTTVRVGNAVVPVVPPSEIVGDESTWSSPIFVADYFAATPAHAASGNYTQTTMPQAVTQFGLNPTRTGQAFQIKPRETHTTFWDAEHGAQLVLNGRLELIDMLHETYCHHARIVVRSYVEHNVRGLEHLDEPEFIICYKEPPRHHDGGPHGGVNAALIETAGVAARARPPIYSMRGGMADSNAGAEIITSEWAELERLPIPMWTKYYTVPIPARLFETRESRFFRLDATIYFLSKLVNGRYFVLRAPPVQVSVSHLVSSRELGIPWPRPSRHPFDQDH